MPPHKSFDEQLEFGRRGERLVEQWLHSIGMLTLPAYDFSGQGAPQLRHGTRKLAAPDIFGAKGGRSFWFEVKTYTAPAENHSRKCKVHGMAGRLWDGYAEIGRTSGIPVHVLVLETSTRELRSVEIGKVETWGCQCAYCRSGQDHRCSARPVKRPIYWRRDPMRLLHTFADADVAAVLGREAA